MNDIVTVISTVGFPIASCIGLGWYIVNTQKELIKVVQANTRALDKLSNFYDKGGAKNENR